MNLRDIRVYFIIGVILLIIVTALFITMLPTRTTDQQNPVPTVTPVSQPSFGQLTPEPSETRRSTGANDDSFPPEEKAAANQGSELRKRLPLTGDGFSISFDYDQAKYIVTIELPTRENKQKFETWRRGKGFGAIPLDQFVFIQ